MQLLNQKKLLTWFFLLASSGLVFVLVPMLRSTLQVREQNLSYQQRLDQEVSDYKLKNDSLRRQALFLQGAYGKEKLVRESMNMKRRGELVYMIEVGTGTGAERSDQERSEEISTVSATVVKQDNFQLWKNLFFAK